MTFTSTSSEDIRSSGTQPNFQDLPEYPTVFGITLTPAVNGLICGLLGVAGTAYLLMNTVLPAREEYQRLKADLQTKEAALAGLKNGEIQKSIADLQNQIAQVKALEPQVLSMFSSEDTLNTLLLDINKVISSSDAELISYKPDGTEATIISDGSLGELVNGKLKRRGFSLEIEGSFEQTLSIVRNLERLQPLLITKNLNAKVKEPPTYLFGQAQVIPLGQPLLSITFNVDAIMPAEPAQ